MPKAPKAKVGQDKKVIHPNSRKAMVLARNISHDKRLMKSKKERVSKLSFLIERFQWFKNELEDFEDVVSRSEQVKLVSKYLERFQGELDQIKIINSIGKRKGVRHASREASIKMTVDMETSQFRGEGLEIPDLLDPDNIAVLKSWDGEYSLVPKIKTTRVSSNDVRSGGIADNKDSGGGGGGGDKAVSRTIEELANDDDVLLGNSDEDDGEDRRRHHHHNSGMVEEEEEEEDDVMLASDVE